MDRAQPIATGRRPELPSRRARWFAAAAVLSGLVCGGEAGPTDVGPPPPVPPPPPPPAGAAYRVEYGTYVGGSGEEEAREPVLLSGGRLLFGARTESPNAPTTAGAFQRSFGGGSADSYLAILSADGSRFEAATYFGGSGMERPPYGIAVAANGDIVFASGTASPNLPTSATSYRPSLHPAPIPSPGDGYVCRISADLRTMRWCTYTGGGWPRGGLVLDAQENVIVVGETKTSSSFATTAGVVQPQSRGPNDAFLMKLSSDGRQAIFSTRLGGSANTTNIEVALSVKLFPNGDISVVGASQSNDFPTTPGAAQRTSTGLGDGFIARLSPSAGAFVYSTLIGGSGDDAAGHPHALLPDGSVIVTGGTDSPTLPGASGSRRGSNDGLLAKLNPAGTAFEFVRFLGGSGDEHILGPVVDAQGLIYVAGGTTSRDIPVTADALQPTYGGGAQDGVLFILNPDGSLRYASYVGGSGGDLVRGVALGPSGEIYLVGHTDSDNFPITSGAAQTRRGGSFDGFVLKLVPR